MDELFAELDAIPMTVDWNGMGCEVLAATAHWLFALTPDDTLLAQVGRDAELAPFPAEHLVNALRLLDQGFHLEIRARVGGGDPEVLDPVDTAAAFRIAFSRWLPSRPSDLELDTDDWAWLWSQEQKSA